MSNAAFLGSYSIPLFHYLPSTSGISWATGPIGAPCYQALHLFPASFHPIRPTSFPSDQATLLNRAAYSHLQSLLTLLLSL